MGRKPLFQMLIILACLLLLTAASPAGSPPWEKLDEGLHLNEFFLNAQTAGNECGIIVLKIDPAHYDLQLLTASEHDRKSRTISQWSKDFSLVAAINASMYQGVDYFKSTGYMRNYRHNNNLHINRSFGEFLTFNPVEPSFSRVQMVDRRLQKDWKQIIKKYQSVVQNYRMISFGRKRGWPQQSQRHGTAAIAMDAEKQVLFILSRVPLSTHDLITALLSLPINIQSAMYVEGGPQAALHLRAGTRNVTWIGVCDANFVVPDYIPEFELPNVIGIRKRNRR